MTSRVPRTAVCRWCGIQFIRARTGRPALYCRSGCRSAHHNASRLGYGVTLAELLERQRHKCGLCGGRIDRVGTGDHGPSIDHILPWSLGGSHDGDNLQVAHWGCNRAKANRPDYLPSDVLSPDEVASRQLGLF